MTEQEALIRDLMNRFDHYLEDVENYLDEVRAIYSGEYEGDQEAFTNDPIEEEEEQHIFQESDSEGSDLPPDSDMELDELAG